MNGDAKKQKIVDRLAKLAGDGRLTPDQVVKDARKETSPLHGEFEWDDSVAAHKYRIEQARDLIAGHKVYIERRTYTITAPAYVRDPSAENGEQGYRSVASLKSDRDLAREALVTEAGRAAAYLERVRSLAVALDLENELEPILEQFSAFQRVVQARAA
jgi:hypothetical protein